MPYRKRKKPPDLPHLSLHSFFCNCHALTPDLPGLSIRSLSLCLGVRRSLGGGQSTGFAHTLDLRLLFEFHTADRSRSGAIGGSDASPYPKSSLGMMLCLIDALFCNRTSAGYGKVVLEYGFSSGSNEVWFSNTLICWVYLILSSRAMLIWWISDMWYCCPFLFTLYMSCSSLVCGRVPCMFRSFSEGWGFLSSAVRILYIAAHFFLQLILCWFILCTPICVTMSSPPSAHPPSVSSNMPFSSSQANFAEALILGGSSPRPVSTPASTLPPLG